VTDLRLLRTSRELFLSVLTGGTADLETWVLDRMTSVVAEEDVEAGKRLFARGEPPELIFFVQDGRVRLEREGQNPWIFEGRSVIGVFDAVLERPHERTAVAETRLHLLRLHVDHWIDLLEDSFGLARAALANSVFTVASLETRLWAGQRHPRGAVVARVSPPPPPLAFVDRLAILAELPLLRAAGIQVLVELADSVEELTFPQGALLHERHERRGQAFFVLEGEATAARNAPDIEVLFGPGTFVGGAASLGDPMLAWRASAVTPMRVLSMHLDDWFDHMEEHFDLARSALSALALLREAILHDLGEKGEELRVG
jgi:CRP-like cAMP-binding protein